MKHPATRNTIYAEEARVMEHHALPAGQYLLKLHAPSAAAHAQAGNFIHLQCDPGLPMRRPMSIMRTDRRSGSIDILYKIHGEGTRLLAHRKPGDIVPMLGPIGVPFKLDNYRKFPLLLGGGVGIPPMVFLAEHTRKSSPDIRPFVIMGSEIPFPFQPRPSQIMLNGLPGDTIATLPLLEDLGIPCRLTSLQGYPGCFTGYVTDLARIWLDALAPEQVQAVEIFACGPTVMLEATSRLAQEYQLPCQISMEEYMACAIGGCAGCAIPIHAENGIAMKRVCVDGPVFDANTVFPVAAG
jgi:dihydroorotate dehydrogenase electron transfer subunit